MRGKSTVSECGSEPPHDNPDHDGLDGLLRHNEMPCPPTQRVRVMARSRGSVRARSKAGSRNTSRMRVRVRVSNRVRVTVMVTGIMHSHAGLIIRH